MKPDEMAAWFPVIRDYMMLVIGIGLGIYGIIAKLAGVASVGWGLAAGGAIGRVKSGAE